MRRRVVTDASSIDELITVAEFARNLRLSNASVYNRIKSNIIVVEQLKGVQKLLNPILSRIRFQVAENVRLRKAYSLERIGGILEQTKCDDEIRKKLLAGEREEAIARFLASRIIAE
jgi:hypothetical protein